MKSGMLPPLPVEFMDLNQQWWTISLQNPFPTFQCGVFGALDVHLHE